jgi:hypothetical protein
MRTESRTGIGRRSAVLALALLAGTSPFGCGSTSPKTGDVDASTDTKTDPQADGSDAEVSAPLTGMRSFDVVARLTPQQDGGIFINDFPATNKFTLVLDAAGLRLIAGAGGQVSVLAVTSADGRTFHVSDRFTAGLPGSGCAGIVGVDYETLDFTVNGTSLTGHARGGVTESCGDCQFSEAMTAELTGTADVTAPTLSANGSASLDPFGTFGFMASEPLPPTATAQLDDGAGHALALTPITLSGNTTLGIPVVIGFTKPNVVLQPGTGYSVTTSGLVDFAGNSGASGVPLRVAAFAPAPLVPEDGFESATGPTLGGGAVITSGPVPPLSGTHSLYVGAMGAPSLGGVAPGTAFAVRLALQAGDTVVRFSYRTVSTAPGGFAGSIVVGSVGGTSASGSVSITAAPTIAQQPSLFVGDVQTLSIQLPADAANEVVVGIFVSDFSCGPRPAPAALLIDDLRAE